MATLLYLVLVCFMGKCVADTCQEIAVGKSVENHIAKDGVFMFKTRETDPYLIYCDFETGYGYTYISNTAFQPIDIFDHSFDRSEFKVVLLYSNGSQYESTISRSEELARHIRIVYSYESANSRTVINHQMLPYITVNMKARKTNVNSRSYLVNGIPVVKDVCDAQSGDPHRRLIFAFLFNHRNIKPRINQHGTRGTEFLRQWIDLGTLVPNDKHLPRNFFSFFEVQFKHCGGSMTSDEFPEIIGAALGLKYVISCSNPPDVKEASKQFTGRGDRYKDTVTYKCHRGFELYSGNGSLTCSELGEWIGEVPRCIASKPRSCYDHITMNGATISGVYIVYDRENEPYSVYCDFYEKYITTFITPAGMKKENLHELYNDESVAIVRAYLTDDRQVESELAQIDAFSTFPIKFVADGLQLFVVFLENYHSDSQQIEVGFKVNGNSYMYEKYSRYYYSGVDLKYNLYLKPPSLEKRHASFQSIMGAWLNDARDIQGERYLPRSYFYSFTLDFDDTDLTESSFQNLYGITIGFRYKHIEKDLPKVIL